MANGMPIEGAAAGERQLDFGSVQIPEKGGPKNEAKLSNVGLIAIHPIISLLPSSESQITKTMTQQHTPSFLVLVLMSSMWCLSCDQEKARA